jgi:hypothetical protein
MVHGYFDSVHVPLHLPSSAFTPLTSSSAKGKGKETAGAPPQDNYNVVQHWTPQEKDDMRRKVEMASLRPSFPPLSPFDLAC